MIAIAYDIRLFQAEDQLILSIWLCASIGNGIRVLRPTRPLAYAEVV